MKHVVNEEWRDVSGYERLYQVSNLGRVRSLDRWRKNGSGEYKQKGRILNQGDTTTGYKQIVLNKDKKRKTLKVHRLVAIAFIPNPENKPNVNHIDGNPHNNNVENLEWCTQAENVQHAINTGLKRCNIIDKEILEDMHYNKKMSTQAIAKEFGVTKMIIIRNMKKYGLERKRWTNYNLTKEFILEELKNKTQTQLAKEIGCNQSLISKILNKKENEHVK